MLASWFPESQKLVALDCGPSFRHFGTRVFERLGVGRHGVPTREVMKSRKQRVPELHEPESLIHFRHFGTREFKSEGIMRQGVLNRKITKSRNAKTRKNLKSKGGPRFVKTFSVFQKPGVGRDKEPGRALMQESRNSKTGKACWFRIEESIKN
jgi:hypothetical protein